MLVVENHGCDDRLGQMFSQANFPACQNAQRNDQVRPGAVKNCIQGLVYTGDDIIIRWAVVIYLTLERIGKIPARAIEKRSSSILKQLLGFF
jgi:hypothetical protein